MFEPSIWGKNLEGWKKNYMDNYALWVQLYGCIGLFGSFFVVIWEIPAYVGLPIISIFMFVSGVIACTFNWMVDPM